MMMMRDEVTGECRKLHNEELNDLYCSPNIVQVIKSRMRWEEHVARMRDTRGVYRMLVGKLEEKRPLGRPRCTWEDNINMDLKKMGDGMDYYDSVYSQILGNKSSRFMKCGEFPD